MSNSRRGRGRGFYDERHPPKAQIFNYDNDGQEEKQETVQQQTLGNMHVRFNEIGSTVFHYNLPTTTHSQLEDKEKNNSNPLESVDEAQSATPKTISVQIPTYPLDQYVKAANIIPDADPNRTAQKIANEFNKYISDGVKAMSENSYWWPGSIKLKQGEFQLAERDGRPELAAYTANYLCESTSIFNFSSKVIMHASYTLKQKLFGLYGTWVLVVDEGFYGRVVVDHKHVIYDEGIHVIHGTHVQVEASDLYVDKRVKEFSWGNIHIVRVKANQLAKVTVDMQPYLLEHRPQPYCFVSAVYSFDGIEKKDEPFFEHENLTRAVLRNNEYAIVNRSGSEELISPPENGDPILFTRSTDKVNAIISTSYVTKTFPAQPDNFTKDPLKTGYEFCASKDGVEIAFKINISYRISAPSKLLNQGLKFQKGIDEIANAVEQELIRDLKRIIQTTNLRESLVKRQSAEPKDPNFKLFDKSDSLNQEMTDSLHTHLKEKLQHNVEKLGVEIKDIILTLQPCLGVQAQTPAVMDILAKHQQQINEMYSFFIDPVKAQEKIKQRQAQMAAERALASKTDTSLSSIPSRSASSRP